ncbi:MAG: hypothetical protein H0V39_01925 [Nitrosomonas sp.]|nr:hypothetical protein [Nitrosomonas sp.]
MLDGKVIALNEYRLTHWLSYRCQCWRSEKRNGEKKRVNVDPPPCLLKTFLALDIERQLNLLLRMKAEVLERKAISQYSD